MSLKRQRFLAFFIDLLIINAVINVLGLLFKGRMFLFGLFNDDYDFDVKVTFELFYYLIYFVFFDIFKEGITIGKDAAGLSIADRQGQIPDRNELVKRTFLKMIGVVFLPIAALVYLIADKSIQDSYTDMKVVQGNP